MDNEIWRASQTLPRYEVSDQGRVRHAKTKRIRTLINDNTGYKRITASLEGVHRQFAVSRLVCEAFHGLPTQDKPWALHRDGNPHNNSAENLYWSDNSANQADSVQHGTHWEARMTHCKRGHEFNEENTYHRRDGKTGRNCRACARENRVRQPRKEAGHG